MSFESIKSTDPETYANIMSELERQRNGLEMIPSENFTSTAVLDAMGSILTNKYSEGYPGRRYYGGNEFIDRIERTAQDRAKKLFGVPYANVQPYSGSPANLAVYFAVCKPGDTISGQNLQDGGHLTHGWKTSVTGMAFNSIPYHVKKDGYIDIEEVARIADTEKPKLIWIGATAYSRALPFKEFAEIADRSGAYLAADISHISGLIVGGAHESPVKYAHIVTTTTHKTLRGPRGAIIMVTDKGIAKDKDLPDKIDKIIIPGMQGGPHNHITAGMSVAMLEAAKPEFSDYARQIVLNSKALAETLTEGGIRLVTGGTDNHLMLIDLTPIGPGLGVFLQDALDAAGITVNKNTIPNDPSSPFYPSGVRLGTPAITTRGMKEKEMKIIGGMITEVYNEITSCALPSEKEERSRYVSEFKSGINKNERIMDVRRRVKELCGSFPLYPGL